MEEVEDASVLPLSRAVIAFAVAALEVPELAVPDMLSSVWLIDINWSNWFSETIWPTIWVGSTGDVGS